MKTTALCPISDKRIDDHVARFNGGFTVLFLTVFLVTGNILPIVLLTIDFALRSGKYSSYSGFSFLSKIIIKSLTIKPEFINAGPKIFAARIGLFFNIAILISALFGFTDGVYSFAGIFGICAFLESALGICVACRIYPYVYKLFYHHKIEKLKI
jgi:hypothetical protein